MTQSDTPVCFIGPFPQPVNGQSLSTQHLFDRLHADNVPLVRFDSSDGIGIRRARLWRKLTGTLKALGWILSHKTRSVYLSVNANAGLYLTVVLARAARMRGHRIFLHHHTRSHLTADNYRMNLLCQAAGNAAVHIAICPTMSDMVRASSQKAEHVLNYSNIGVVVPPSRPTETRNSETLLVLGHLSNLTFEKGLGRVLETFRHAKTTGRAARLILGGPAHGAEEQAAIQNAKAEFGSDFEWRGPIYGSDKDTFFEDIDVFLFPSLYRNETQGIVNLEALAFDVPVLAFDVCCTGSDLQGPAAATVAPDADFTAATDRFLDQVGNQDTGLARARFDYLYTGYNAQYAMLRDALMGTDTQIG